MRIYRILIYKAESFVSYLVKRCAAVLVLAVVLLAGSVALPNCVRPARADEFTVYSPIVEQGERELELKGATEWDAGQRAAREDNAVVAVGAGFTEHWFSEVELYWQRVPGTGLQRSATSWENVLQLTPQGEYWLDAGVLGEMEAAARSGQPSTVELGPLLQKQRGHLLAIVNLKAASQFGSNAASAVWGEYAGQLRWLRASGPELGLEAFGEPHEQRAGPVVYGRVRLGGRANLRYEVGYLAALTASTPDHTLKARLELEF